jgi:hypothetical protein
MYLSRELLVEIDLGSVDSCIERFVSGDCHFAVWDVGKFSFNPDDLF